MATFKASHRYARIAPRKARLIMDLVRGRDVDDAITLLRFSKQRASGMIEKVIRSAVANANEQEAANIRNTLYVAKAWVDPGPIIKRQCRQRVGCGGHGPLTPVSTSRKQCGQYACPSVVSVLCAAAASAICGSFQTSPHPPP